jgi:alkylated DNA nucleotide flippase Atl1
MQESFFDRVYEVTKRIPKGRITTYGLIAHYLGSGRSARMVGWALSSSEQKWTSDRESSFRRHLPNGKSLSTRRNFSQRQSDSKF